MNSSTHKPANRLKNLIREISTLETKAVSGGALSITPDQIPGIAKDFKSVGGGTATSGITPKVTVGRTF